MLLIPIILPLLGGAVVFRLRTRRARTAVAAATLCAALGAVLAVCLSGSEPLVLGHVAGGLTLRLALDGLGRFFALLIASVWTLVLPFAVPYIAHEGRESQFFGFYTMTLGVLMGLCFAGNVVTMYLFYELMTLITVPLVLHSGTEEARHAAIKYLGYSVAGAACALFGAFLIAGSGGMGDFAAGGILTSRETRLVTAWFLMTMGFGCKAGLLPLQAWLTTAHPVAPAPASAVLSGIITKGGVLAIVRVTYFVFGTELLRGTWAQKWLLGIALATIFTGSMLAYKEKLLKKRLAYSTVSQVSYALLGILLLSPQGLLGALLQILFHACAKCALFLGAGAMIFRTGRLHCGEYRGIGREMPVTLGCFTLASLSLIGIPPTGGFFSKWYLATGALAQDAVFGCVATVVLLVSALLTALYLLPIVADGFFPGEDFVPQEREVGWAMRVPMLVFAAAVLVLGVFSGTVTQLLAPLAAALV